MSQARRVLIVEDQEIFANSLQVSVMDLLKPDDLRIVDTVSAATRALTECAPDLVMLDLGLPDGHGFDVIAACQKLPRPPVIIVLTIFDDDGNLFEALRRGVEGYVLKEESGATLRQLVCDILEGRPPLSPSIARRVLSHFAVNPETSVDSLTDRERTILQLLAKGCTVARTAERLGISAHTVQHHVKSLYRKLDVSSRAEMARAAVDMGIL